MRIDSVPFEPAAQQVDLMPTDGEQHFQPTRPHGLISSPSSKGSAAEPGSSCPQLSFLESIARFGRKCAMASCMMDHLASNQPNPVVNGFHTGAEHGSRNRCSSNGSGSTASGVSTTTHRFRLRRTLLDLTCPAWECQPRQLIRSGRTVSYCCFRRLLSSLGRQIRHQSDPLPTSPWLVATSNSISTLFLSPQVE